MVITVDFDSIITSSNLVFPTKLKGKLWIMKQQKLLRIKQLK